MLQEINFKYLANQKARIQTPISLSLDFLFQFFFFFCSFQNSNNALACISFEFTTVFGIWTGNGGASVIGEVSEYLRATPPIQSLGGEQGNGNHHRWQPSTIRVISAEQANKVQVRDKHKSNKNSRRSVFGVRCLAKNLLGKFKPAEIGMVKNTSTWTLVRNCVQSIAQMCKHGQQKYFNISNTQVNGWQRRWRRWWECWMSQAQIQTQFLSRLLTGPKGNWRTTAIHWFSAIDFDLAPVLLASIRFSSTFSILPCAVRDVIAFHLFALLSNLCLPLLLMCLACYSPDFRSTRFVNYMSAQWVCGKESDGWQIGS